MKDLRHEHPRQHKSNLKRKLEGERENSHRLLLNFKTKDLRYEHLSSGDLNEIQGREI